LGDCNNRISIFNSQTGDYLTSFGSDGAGKLHFNNPIGITSDDNGRLYIADSGNSRIQIYTEDGVYIGRLGGTSNLEEDIYRPVAIIVRDSELYISDEANHRISIWDRKSGKYLRSFGQEGSAIGEFTNPHGMTLTSQNELIICDFSNHRLQIFE